MLSGDGLCLRFRGPPSGRRSVESMDPSNFLPILYRDNCLIAVSKPSGMFVHRTAEDRSDKQVVLQILRDQIGEYIYSIHRLDRATSGVVLLATTKEAASAMSTAFAERAVSKTYMALVRGHCETEGQISRPLISSQGRDKPAGHPMAQPKEAMTFFCTLKKFEIPISCGRYDTTRSSLIEVQPRTGRFHQIRRHMNFVSHPVIGDTTHGDSRHNVLYREHFALERLMLAAVRLEFRHPTTGESVSINCPPNASFSNVIQRLESCSHT